MLKQAVIKKIADEVKKRLNGEPSGHDWWHVLRVWNMAKRIGHQERADMLVVELSALLHDVADWKFHNGDETIGPRLAGKIMKSYRIPPEIVNKVKEIISQISFKGEGVKTKMLTLEGRVVQDADRLDALGAIGIARAFSTGARFNEVIHDPKISPAEYSWPSEYVASAEKNGQTVINHFYEKLLLIKDRMNTRTAKIIAVGRHKFLKEYLKRFYQEWDGKN